MSSCPDPNVLEIRDAVAVRSVVEHSSKFRLLASFPKNWDFLKGIGL